MSGDARKTDERRDDRPLPIDEALRLLETRVRAAEADLASCSDAGEGVLDYLARHGATATRRAVAENPTTSQDTNLFLAGDTSERVREALAQKIGRLFPGMLLAEEARLRDLAIKILEKLAADEAVRVRAVLADGIKNYDCVPRRVVKKLATDTADDVASPMVEFSPLLEDDDLIEIVAAAETNDILSAVARRKGLTEKVSDAVVATSDTKAVAQLLKNVDAAIRKCTLDRIVSQAAEIAEWQGPLVLRAELSAEAVRRIASYVGSALIRTLAARNNLDAGTESFLKQRLEERRKIECAAPAKEETENDAPTIVERAHRAGMLNDAFVAKAIEEHRRETVVCALARLAKVDGKTVRTILETDTAKPITALVWKAGLGMRIAFKIQTTIMHLGSDKLLPAISGTDFPLSGQEMTWQLGCFGIK